MSKPENTNTNRVEDTIRRSQDVLVKPIVFEQIEVDRSRYKFTVHVTAAQLTRGLAKVVVHVKNCSDKDLDRLSGVLAKEIMKLNIPGTSAQASLSPVYRNQWDLVWLNVPQLLASVLCAKIKQAVLKAFP